MADTPTHQFSSLRQMQEEIHATAVEKGWWETDRKEPEILVLIHSEVSEALEAWRENDYYSRTKDGKPEGMWVELADVIIRILDYAGHEKVDMAEIIREKMKYNKTRSHRHGGKRA